MIELEVKNIDNLLKAFTDFEAESRSVVQDAIDDCYVYLKTILKKYPPERTARNHVSSSIGGTYHYFKSGKGTIESTRISTYKRTGRLKAGWASADPQVNISGPFEFTSSLTNDVPYASYVQGPSDLPGTDGGQAWMHKGYWETIDRIITEDSADTRVRRIFNKAIKTLIDKKFGTP